MIANVFRLPEIPALCGQRLALIAVMVLCHAASLLALDWGANATETLVQTRADSVRSVIVDQQYQLHATGELAPTLDYFASLNYHHVKSYTGDSSSSWRTELQPAISAVWSVPFFKVRSDYSYRDNRDQFNVNRLIGRSADVNIQTNWSSLPRLSARYSWSQNVNDLDLLGLDTRQRIIGGAADYSFSSTTLRYEYADAQTENHRTGLAQTMRSHTGHFENSLSLLNRMVSLQSSYMVVLKTDREQRPGDEGVLISLTPLAGLWAVNPTPELGALTSYFTLIDGNLDSAASPLMNLSGSDVQNFGLDFGSPVNLDHIFLYTDSLANAGLRWSLYTSADNYNWTNVQGFQVYPFSIPFRRYEVSFPEQRTRYVKLVTEPQPLQNPVYVTEIRGLLTRTGITSPGWATDHEAAMNLGIQPSKWLFGSVEGTLIQHGASPTTIARRQDGLTSALHFTPARLLDLAGQYQFNRTEYPGTPDGTTDTELLGFTLISRWLSGLRTVLAGSRQWETVVNRLDRRLDGGNLRVDATFLPGLGGSTEAGFTEDHRFLAEDLNKTRYIGQSVQAQPTDRFQFSVDYRYYWLRSLRGPTPPYRENVTLQGTYRLTETLQLSGNASRLREAATNYATYQGLLNWNATPKLVLSASADRTLPDQGSNTLLLTAQGLFRWSARSDISASYSHLTSEQSARENFSNLRFGFTFRI